MKRPTLITIRPPNPTDTDENDKQKASATRVWFLILFLILLVTVCSVHAVLRRGGEGEERLVVGWIWVVLSWVVGMGMGRKHYTGKSMGFFLGMAVCSSEILLVGTIFLVGYRDSNIQSGASGRLEVMLITLYTLLAPLLLLFVYLVFNVRNSSTRKRRKSGKRSRSRDDGSVHEANQRWNKWMNEEQGQGQKEKEKDRVKSKIRPIVYKTEYEDRLSPTNSKYSINTMETTEGSRASPRGSPIVGLRPFLTPDRVATSQETLKK